MPCVALYQASSQLLLLLSLSLSLFFELFLADFLLFLLLSEDFGEDGLLPVQIGVLHNFVNFALVRALRHGRLNGQSTPFPFLLVHGCDGCQRFFLGTEFYEAKATIQVAFAFQWHIYFNYRAMFLEFSTQMLFLDVEAKVAYNDPSSMWLGLTCCLLLAFLLDGLIRFLPLINRFLVHDLTFVLFFSFIKLNEVFILNPLF